jgi:hypothetical protein
MEAHRLSADPVVNQMTETEEIVDGTHDEYQNYQQSFILKVP